MITEKEKLTDDLVSPCRQINQQIRIFAEWNICRCCKIDSWYKENWFHIVCLSPKEHAKMTILKSKFNVHHVPLRACYIYNQRGWNKTMPSMTHCLVIPRWTTRMAVKPLVLQAQGGITSDCVRGAQSLVFKTLGALLCKKDWLFPNWVKFASYT